MKISAWWKLNFGLCLFFNFGLCSTRFIKSIVCPARLDIIWHLLPVFYMPSRCMCLANSISKPFTNGLGHETVAKKCWARKLDAALPGDIPLYYITYDNRQTHRVCVSTSARNVVRHVELWGQINEFSRAITKGYISNLFDFLQLLANYKIEIRRWTGAGSYPGRVGAARDIWIW